MQRSWYTHIAKQVIPYSQESTTGSLPHSALVHRETYLSMSTEQKKQYKVLTELMTHMFQQRGHLPEENIIEMDKYQAFLRALQHHVYMGNVSTTQLTSLYDIHGLHVILYSQSLHQVYDR